MTKYILTFLVFFSFQVFSLEKVAPGEVAAAKESSENLDLTDEQRYESKVYVHQGLSKRMADEACAKLKDPEACAGRGSTKFLGMDSNMVQGIAKAYSYFSGMMGANGKLNSPKGKAGSGAKNSQGKSGQRDYCAFIPMAGEQVASYVQQAEQKKIESTPVQSRNAQKERLYQAARSHGTRAKTAKMQGTVWGSATACYGVLVATGKTAIDKKVILRAGAAGLLTTFWLNESKQQKKYEKEVKEIADNLPGEGDCNPHTQTHCYCSQPETRYDPTHCLDNIRGNAAVDSSQRVYQVPCTNADGENDPQCLCIGEENCMDTQLFSNLKLPGMTTFASSNAGNNTRNLFRGTLSAGDLNGSSSGQRAAIRSLFGKLEDKLSDPTQAPTGEQVNVSKKLQSLGVPPKLSRHMAISNANSFGQKRAARANSSVDSSNFLANQKKSPSHNQILTFEGGRKKIGSHKKSSNSNPSIAQMMRRYGKKSKSQNGSQILRFSRQAQKSASIHKKSDRPLFDIISRRYRLSGRRHLLLEK